MIRSTFVKTQAAIWILATPMALKHKSPMMEQSSHISMTYSGCCATHPPVQTCPGAARPITNGHCLDRKWRERLQPFCKVNTLHRPTRNNTPAHPRSAADWSAAHTPLQNKRVRVTSERIVWHNACRVSWVCFQKAFSCLIFINFLRFPFYLSQEGNDQFQRASLLGLRVSRRLHEADMVYIQAELFDHWWFCYR